MEGRKIVRAKEVRKHWQVWFVTVEILSEYDHG